VRAEAWGHNGKDLDAVAPLIERHGNVFWRCLAVQRKVLEDIKEQDADKAHYVIKAYAGIEALNIELRHVR
jgi:hypothetical protein